MIKWAAFVAYMYLSWQAYGQPGGIPPGGNDACTSGPGNDTVVSTPDAEGFYSLFNGTDLTGWWESCQTAHSGGDAINGGFWIVDPDLEAIFSQQANSGAGSILMTNKKYSNYEIQFDFWPDFGNDGGVFHRTSANGRCFQTVLDYINGSSVGGAFGEGGYQQFNTHPYDLGGDENTIINNFWTYTGAWADAWDVDGWNQIKIEVFGNPPRVRSYQRIVGKDEWIFVEDFTSEVTDQPEGYIGFQIHQGSGRWSGREGNWYKEIKVRPLTAEGEPILPSPITGCTDTNYVEYNAAATVSDEAACVTKIGCTDESYTGYDPDALVHDQNYCGEIVGILLDGYNRATRGVYFHSSKPSVSVSQNISHHIRLMDVNGILYDEIKSARANTYTFELLNLVPGVYLIEVQTPLGVAAQKYILK